MKVALVSLAAGLLLCPTLTAQTIRINTVGGESKVYNLSQIESISFDEAPNTEKMVTMEIVNASAYSFDLKIDKSDACKGYMAAVYHQGIYNETNFVESALQTLNPDMPFLPFEKTLRYYYTTFSEAQLGLNALASEDGKTAPSLVAAVYAFDDMGESQVYTLNFSVPAAPVVESTEKATITIDESTLTYNHLDFSIRCGWNVAKVIYAVTQPAFISNSLNTTKWNAMSFAEQQATLLGVFQGIPEPYQSGMKGSYDCNANSTCIVYAIPIDREGKIGQMDIKTVQTGAPVTDGKGAFTTLSAQAQTDPSVYTINVGIDQNAVAYRLMWFTETDNRNSDYVKRMAEILLDSKYEKYGTWTEYPADQTQVNLSVYRPGDKYILYGCTVDRFGRISTPVNLGETYLGNSLITTLPRSN